MSEEFIEWRGRMIRKSDLAEMRVELEKLTGFTCPDCGSPNRLIGGVKGGGVVSVPILPDSGETEKANA